MFRRRRSCASMPTSQREGYHSYCSRRLSMRFQYTTGELPADSSKEGMGTFLASLETVHIIPFLCLAKGECALRVAFLRTPPPLPGALPAPYPHAPTST